MENECVWCHDDHAMNHCLADQHAIKWILMEFRESDEMQRCTFFQQQRLHTVLFSLGWNEPLGRLRQRQSSKGIFDGNFPRGNRAKKNLVCRISKEFPGPRREFRGLGNNPEEGTCVQEDSHCPLPEKALIISGGRGSKNSAGTRKVSFAKPNGRLDFLSGGMGRISATGIFLLHKIMVSPLASFAR